MKQLFAFVVMLFTASMIYAQDVITLKTGETINGKVSEVGINDVKYYKSSNLQGPVYVTAKADLSQIVYENGSKDVFATTQPANPVVVQQPAPQTVIVEQPLRRRIFWSYGLWHPYVITHFNLGYHGGYYYGGGHGRNYGGHHGRNYGHY